MYFVVPILNLLRGGCCPDMRLARLLASVFGALPSLAEALFWPVLDNAVETVIPLASALICFVECG